MTYTLKKELGQVFTPSNISRLMALFFQGRTYDEILDPAAGEDVIIVTRKKNAVSNRVLKLPQSQKTTNWCAA